MANKLFVGGLSYDISEDDLKEEFSKAGAVQSAQIIADRETGKSKGFGFVEMASEEEAKAAIEMFNGQELAGRKLTVNMARPMEESPARKRFGGRR